MINRSARNRIECHAAAHGWMRAARSLLLLLPSLLIGVNTADAAGWQADVAVADRSGDEQTVATEMALRQVILANSGDKTVLNRDAVREAVRNAQQYLAQSGYLTPEPGTALDSAVLLTPRVARSGQATQLLRLEFDAAPLLALIQGENAAERPVAVRPATRTVLLWLQVEDGEALALVAGERGRNVMARVRELAGAAAVSVAFPGEGHALPLQGAMTVDAAEVPMLLMASAPWPSGEIATARVQRAASGGWQGQWRRIELIANEDDGEVTAAAPELETFDGETLDAVLVAGMNWLAPGGAAAGYDAGGPAGVSQAEALIWFGGVSSPGRYAEITRLLGSVQGVQSAWPREMIGDDAIFAVRPRESVRAVQAAIINQGWRALPSLPGTAAGSQLAGEISLAVETRR